MRLVATTTNEGVVLSFTGNGEDKSVSLSNDAAKDMTVPEAIQFLCDHLCPKTKVGIVETEIVETVAPLLDLELDGDEDDEDLSLFEEVVEIKY